MISIHNGTVEFAYFRPTANTVCLTGDFNQWHPGMHPMTRDAEGWWRIRLALQPGEYQFKYIVDDVLFEADFAAYGVQMDRSGGWTSVLWLPESWQAEYAAA